MHDLFICFNCGKPIMGIAYRYGFEYKNLVFHEKCCEMTPKLRRELKKLKGRINEKKYNVEQLTRSNAARDKKDLQA